MAETYDVTYEGEAVGTANIEKQGLYYFFSCRCRLPHEGLYRIHVIGGVHREDLGICIPLDGAFGMDKRIPAKRLGEGIPTFELVPKDWRPQPLVTQQEPEPEPAPQEEEMEIPESAEELFIPVSEEEPFEHLDKLEDAFLEERDDQMGIVIQEE